MNEDLLRALAHDLGADTQDCPTLVHRVSAGVARRRRRQRVVAGALAAVAVAVAGPAVVLDQVGVGHGSSSTAALCTGVVSDCGHVLSVRAELALRRANPPAAARVLLLSYASPSDGCLRRPSCRGPV